ncbi:MAG: DUF4215 domain-containing protein [Myxococcota bacterium]
MPLLLPAEASAAVVPGQIVAQTGSIPVGAVEAIDTVSVPFTEASGAVAFRGTLQSGVGYVFREDRVIFTETDEPAYVLSGGDAALGTNPAEGFIYSPNADGVDSLYTHLGVLALDGTPAPGQPAGTVFTEFLRPSMSFAGQAYWIAGFSFTGGPNTEARALMTSPNATLGSATALLQSGDMVGGFVIDDFSAGIDDDYKVSSGGAHLVAILDMDTGSTADDGFIYVDGVLVAREGDPNGSGEDWDTFDLVTINSAGSYAFSGDTNGATGTDNFIAYNGTVALQEGATVDGVTLISSASVTLVSLNDEGVLAHGCNYEGGGATLFFSCQPGDLGATSRALVSAGDELDTDGDGFGNAIITNLLTPGLEPSRALANDGSLYLRVELDQSGVVSEAVIRLDAACCGNGFVDPGEACDDGNGFGGDGCSALCSIEPPNCGDMLIDFDETCDDGNTDDTDDCPTTCQTATCGDSYVQAGVEECDDGNADDDDACRNTCVNAFCGDGVQWIGPEACDDGNANNFDDCLNNCQVAFCGDGVQRAGLEDCDDGNDVNTDACLDTCVDASCGDGFVHAGVEQCDDGNADDGDACPSTCAAATCGDGFLQAGVEDCDDGNDDNTDSCLSTCVIASCGDGFLFDTVEECDDGDADNDDECLVDCTLASCGDGFIQTGVEECDDGNEDNSDACVTGCVMAVCGDGFVRDGVEECDDGNTNDSDDCSNECLLVVDPTTTGVDGTGTDTDTDADSGTGTGTSSSGGPTTPPFPGTTTTGGPGETGPSLDTGSSSCSGTSTLGVPLDDDGGCSCSTNSSGTNGQSPPLRQAVVGLLTLGLLGLGRRRRRRRPAPRA